MLKTTCEKNSLSNPLRYHLRFQIVPGKNVERDSHILVDFCKSHSIEEVVLFFAAGEWNNGLLSKKEEDMWFDTIKKAKSILNKAGIIVSLNPGMTVGHCSRGRAFPQDREFKPMVSPTGKVSKACASFADPKWRDYVYKLYRRFAKLGFRVIWVEDDFRYHNHKPLDWGGGFEIDVLNRFAEKVKRKVTREEVVKNILKPGKPHPWRRKWMETWCEIQLEVARDLAKAVAENSPSKTKIGLMSSHPDIHSIEGRDWQRLFNAFSINSQVAHRPNFAEYNESLGKDKAHSIMMLDIQRNFRPAYCEVAPEIENSPFTNWNKSDTLTWTEMALAMFYGSDALLLDLFPFSGNPANEEPQIGKLLDKSRPALEWISAKFPRNLQTCGVGIPWKQDAQAYVHTVEGKSMEELNASSFQPGYFLIPYGVPVSVNRQKINAIFGSIAWAFNNDEIYEMLSEGLLLDGVSADILYQRGFGEYIGVEFEKWVEREESKYSIEMVISKQTGVRKGLYFNTNLLPRLSILKPQKGAYQWSVIMTPERKQVGAGIVVYENKLGGRIVTYAAPNPASLPRSYQRQKIIQKAIDFLSGDKFSPVMVTGGAYLLPIHFKAENKQFVVVLNGSPDPSNPVVRIGGEVNNSIQATLLAPLAKPVKAKVNIFSDKEVVFVTSQTEVPYLGFLVLEW
ncbi:hypothetical protein J7K43_06035 [Candidatus Calescamantes bacterium]|nr:hypothetical protein [Candidatus Calescamantes bacterium]